MLRIEPLSRRHRREGFDCGNPELNDYLRHTARQHLDKGLSRTEVLVDDETPTEILGYVTMSLAEIVTDTLPPRYAKQYPARAHGVKLARLAVAQSRQRQGLGALMIIHVMRRALQVADSAGIIGFFVDAKDEAASHYYGRFGFLALPDDPHKLFLPLATLRQALGKR
ncbi:MAG: GNAT family N-acetyltransferase [Acidobacteriaceae bacterium]